MMKWIANLVLPRFSRRYQYDMTYMHEMAENAPGAFFGLLLTAPVAQYRKAAPKEVYFAAKLVSTRRADCGPCLKLVVNMAREAGVAESTLISILSEDDQVSDHVRLGMDFATAVIDQSAVELAGLKQSVIDQWGRAALTDLSLAVAFGAFFPTLKRGLGHAESCQPVLRSLTASQSQAT